jgi:hypothetical protein
MRLSSAKEGKKISNKFLKARKTDMNATGIIFEPHY